MASAKKQITIEQIKAKELELTEKYGVKVTAFAFFDELTEEKIVGYVKEPNRLIKQRAMDKMMLSASSAGEDILVSCLIKEESNLRILSELSSDDSIFLGACNACLAMVKVMQNTIKKS